MTENLIPVVGHWMHSEGDAPSCADPRRRPIRAAAAGAAALFCFAVSVDAPAQHRMYDGWEGGPYMMPWNMGWIGPLLMFALWVALIAAVLIFIKRWIQTSKSGNQAPPPRPSAMDILRERYARGEIDKQEFEEKRRVLEDNR